MPEPFRFGWRRCRPGIVPISERHRAYAETIQAKLQDAGLRVEVDHRNEKMGAKIRDFTLQKLPYILIVGDKEAETGGISLRVEARAIRAQCRWRSSLRGHGDWWIASLPGCDNHYAVLGRLQKGSGALRCTMISFLVTSGASKSAMVFHSNWGPF